MLFFKKKYKREDCDYTVTFIDNIMPMSIEDEDGNIPVKGEYVNYVDAKSISSDLKVRGTKYYIGKSKNKDSKNNFTMYLRCRYNKIGREYIRELLSDLIRNTFEGYTIKQGPNGRIEESCRVNILDILSGNLDYIFEDVIDVYPFYKVYFSFKELKDKNKNFVEGYIIFDSSTDQEFIDFLRNKAKSTSINK